jgi:hypothetical protein
MGYSPFFRALGFWGSFYIFQKYASRDENNRHRFPSYLIFKELVIVETWEKGFDSGKLSESFGKYSSELWSELKSLTK